MKTQSPSGQKEPLPGEFDLIQHPFTRTARHSQLAQGDHINGASNSSAIHSENESLLRPKMPELDAIRGIAILGVLFYHGLYWQIDLTRFPSLLRLFLTLMWTGRLGVNLFFVLSGFLITGLLVDSRERPDYYARFYVRRALRILPAYLLTMLVLVVFSLAPWKFIALSLLYVSNLTPLWGIPIAYPVLWSLAVEEHFYFVWPTIARKFSMKKVLYTCAGIILVSPVLRLFAFLLTEKNGFVSFVCNEYTWNAADGLACGALLAVYLRIYKPSRVRLAKIAVGWLALSVALWVGGLPWGILTRERPVGTALQVVPWQFAFIAVVAGALILGTGKSPLKGFSHSKTLSFFGEISYGLYLYHLLVFEAVDSLARKMSIRHIGTGSPVALLSRFLASTIAVLI